MSTLECLGFVERAVNVPVPHAHHDRAERDAVAAELLRSDAWTKTPLQPQDEL